MSADEQGEDYQVQGEEYDNEEPGKDYQEDDDLEAPYESFPGSQRELNEDEAKPLDESEVNPTKRGCTDMMCCILFIAALVALVGMHISCFSKASPFKILHPLDHSGNTCGYGDHKDFPLVYYPAKKMIHGGELVQDAYYGDPHNRWSVCTSECPQKYSATDRPGKCNEPSNATDNSSHGATCTWYSQNPSSEVLGRYCISSSSYGETQGSTSVICTSAQQAIADVHAEAERSFYDLGNVTTDDLAYLRMRIPQHQMWVIDAIENSIKEDSSKYAATLDEVSQQAKDKHIVQVCTDAQAKQESTTVGFVSDVLNAHVTLILCAVMCLVFGLLYLITLVRLVGIVIWGSIFAAIVGFTTTGGLLWDQHIQVKDTGLLQQAEEEQVLAVLCWIMAVILLIVVFLCRRSLQLAIAISKTTSTFLFRNMGILVLPQIIALLELCWFLYWLIGLAGIIATARVRPADNLTQEVDRYVITEAMWAMLIFHGYMGLWVHFFFEGISSLTTSITVTEWYFSPRKSNGSKRTLTWSVFPALGLALRYHMGSLAFGSGILPIAVILKFVISCMKKIGDCLGPDNVLFKVMCCCLNCCLRCVVGCLQFISKNAFILVGVTGNSFMTSGWKVWTLMARNPRRFLVFHGVMWTVDVACRFFLIGVTLAFGALFLECDLSPKVKSIWPPLILAAVIGYVISGLIASVYTTSGAALFFCFVIDEEISSATGRDFTLYAPSGLEALLDAEEKEDAKNDESKDDKSKEDEK